MSEPTEPENMSADELAAQIVCDGAPCPRCMGGCKYLQGDLWQCDRCGKISTAREIMDGPARFS